MRGSKAKMNNGGNSSFHVNRGKGVVAGRKRGNNRRRPHVAGLVLARGGSEAIPLKNLAKLNGVNDDACKDCVAFQVAISGAQSKCDGLCWLR